MSERTEGDYQPGHLSYTFDPFEGMKLDDDARSAAIDEAASLVKEQLLSYIGDAKSPVKGYGAFKGLSKEYQKFKEEHSSSAIPNLELYGDMLDALQVRATDDGRLQIVIEGHQADKADGHCQLTGRESDNPLPLRRFIPHAGHGETLAPAILSAVRHIGQQYESAASTRSEQRYRDAIAVMVGRADQATFESLGLNLDDME